MGYPSPGSELDMLETHARLDVLDTVKPVTDVARVSSLSGFVASVYVSPAVKEYVVDLAGATRTSAELRLGASPRAALHLVRAARAWAALSEREYVLPDDIQALAGPVLAHRLLPTAEAQIGRRTPEQIVADLVASVPVPDHRGGVRAAGR
jgi:MoxR-like ATPase